MRAGQVAVLALVLGVTSAQAQERDLPEAFSEQLEEALAEAEQGKPAAAMAILGGLKTSTLTPPQRGAAAEECLSGASSLLDDDRPGRALQLYAGIERALPKSVAALEARLGRARAMSAQGKHAQGLKLCADLLVRPATEPSGVASYRQGLMFEVLDVVSDLLLELKRPQEALQALLDRTVLEVRLVGGFELERALGALLGRELTQAEVEVLAASWDERQSRPLRLPKGGTACELRVGTFLSTAATAFAAAKMPGLAKQVAGLATKHQGAVRRAYTLPPLSKHSLEWRRLEREQARTRRTRFPALVQRAKAGDVSAAFEVGKQHSDPALGPAEQRRCLAFLRQAAEAGHQEALVRMIDWSPPDRRVRYALRAFLANSAFAGDKLMDPKAAPKASLTKALDAATRAELLSAARAGNARAWSILARVEPSPKARLDRLERAARGGDPLAFGPLAQLLPTQNRPPLERARFWRRCDALTGRSVWRDREAHGQELAGTAALAKRTLARLEAAALRYPPAAIEAGYVALSSGAPKRRVVLHALRGLVSWRRRGSVAFSKDAEDLFGADRAAAMVALGKATGPEARHGLGEASFDPRYGPTSSSQGILAHREEARAGVREPCFLFDRILEAGELRHLAEAELSWGRAAAKGGDRWAMAYLGHLHQRGIGTPVDPDQALKRFAQAAAKGVAWAELRLADLEFEFEAATGGRRRAEVDQHLAAAIKLGHAAAWLRIARREARFGRTKEVEQAWAKALEARLPEALLRRSEQLLRGKVPDPAAALKLLRESAQSGFVPAYVRLLIVLRLHPKRRVAGDP